MRIPKHYSKFQQGFTLLETIVALVILSISLGVIYQIYANTLRNTSIAEEYTLAQMHAQSHLNSIGKLTFIEPGIEVGSYDKKYRWQLDVRQLPPSVVKVIPFNIVKYAIVLKISWLSINGVRTIEVPTIRLASLPEPT